MTLWIAFAAMSLVAIGFIVRPLVRDMDRLSVLAGATVVFVAASSAGVYWYVGSPDVPSGPGKAPDIAEMVSSLAERLQRQPDDLNGWKMLGRSYMTLNQPAAAAQAYERAVELESAQNASTLIALGVAITEANGRQVPPRAITIFENALTLEPTNPEALFWGGIGASNSGNIVLAADRWEQLLDTGPPPEIANMLRQRIAEWRGEPVSEAPSAPSQAPAVAGAVVTASISVSDAAAAELPTEAVVFIIARDPAQPSPPIAVTRRMLSEMPAEVSLDDRNSMIPGRLLSGFTEVEIVARVSISGTPQAQRGDWFGSAVVTVAGGGPVSIAIAERVP